MNERENPASDVLLLYPNIAAEEADDWRRVADQPAVRTTLRLWTLLFGSESASRPEVVRPDGGRDVSNWLAALGEPPSEPAFAWLPSEACWIPWLATAEEPTSDPDLRGRRMERWSAAPNVVAAVHDKGWAQTFAESEGLRPRGDHVPSEILAPELLRDPAEAVRQIQVRLEAWPAWASRSFTLKPRYGSSGRGRIAGTDGCADTAAIRGGLERLAQRGGALLEPWFARSADLSAQLFVARAADEPAVSLVGTLESLQAPSGLYRGHRGELDSRGRVFSGNVHDESLREAAGQVANAARSAGYWGPCGLDALVYPCPSETSPGDPTEQSATPMERLRPVVEFNARFTLGLLVAGLVRRLLPTVKSRLGLQPGQRHGFVFALEEPGAGWSDLRDRASDEALWVPLWGEHDEGRPALIFARDPVQLDAVADAIQRPESDR